MEKKAAVPESLESYKGKSLEELEAMLDAAKKERGGSESRSKPVQEEKKVQPKPLARRAGSSRGVG